MSYSIQIPIDADSWEAVTTRLAEFAVDGIVEADGVATVFFGSVSAAEEAAGVFGVSAPAFVAQRNWSAALQAEWQPILVGERFFLAPFGCDEPTPDGRLRLAMEPGNVFGGGDHPTTQLCLELLELAARPGLRVADIGAGTGILARGAEALGAWAVAGDVDPAAVFFVDYLGSADALASSMFDVVIANIHLGVLRALEEELRRVLLPGGALLLSGFLEEQAPEVEALFGRPAVLRVAGGWCAGLYLG